MFSLQQKRVGEGFPSLILVAALSFWAPWGYYVGPVDQEQALRNFGSAMIAETVSQLVLESEKWKRI